jgi:hypothetical protein
MNKIKGGVGVLTRPNGQDARPTKWVINIVQLLSKVLSRYVIVGWQRIWERMKRI